MAASIIADPLLAAFTLSIAGMEFGTWFFGFRTRKTFEGGIFQSAWRYIVTSLLFLMVNQVVLTSEAVYGSAFAVDAVAESFEAMGTILILVGFYRFYQAWNPAELRKAR